MTQKNNRFRYEAENLRAKPNKSSWNRLETMLDNQNLSKENKSYKKWIRWTSGTAALILISAVATFFFYSNKNIEQNTQLAYTIETIEDFESVNHELYNIHKLSQLNDPSLWKNIIEGGPKLRVKSDN